MKYLTILVSSFLLCLPVSGQNAGEAFAKVTNVNINLSADSLLNIDMDMVIPAGMDINSNRVMTLNPVLRGENESVNLPSVYVYGRKRKIISERNDRLPMDAYQLVHRKNNSEQHVEYHTSLSYQSWMKQATLYLEQDLCGCGNNREETSEQALAQVAIPDPKPVLPAITYVVPETETFKRRTKAGSAFLDFPVNRTEINPDYRKNPVELAKINQTIESVPKSDILHISIHGYASPEGSYANNTRLAQGRSEALKQYIIRKYQLTDTLFSVQSTPEDWEGARKCVTASDLDGKNNILAIIDSYDGADEKEVRLKKLGTPYIYMLKECFPALRHSDYKIEYAVAAFTAQEARKIVKTQPELLSLREMYDAALLCTKGSDEYNLILETAVRLFPDDQVANLNAAAMELERGNLPGALKYMEKADMSTEAARNNMQRIKLLEGGYNK